MKCSIAVFTFLLSWSLVFGQPQKEVFKTIKGHWEGAFIKSRSSQKIKIQFFESGGNYFTLQEMEEWYPQYGEFQIPFEIDSLGRVIVNTGVGRAILFPDARNLEMTGFLENSVPSIGIHLKKIPAPPAPSFTVEEVKIPNGDIELAGHLHVPKGEVTGALIIVGGRGCYAGSTKYDLYAKALREYGLAVIVFNKRGTGNSTGDCSTATISDLTSDVHAVRTFLENHGTNFPKIGVLGSSAGGWVIMKASETKQFDFMISIVGPSTSVQDQQLQSGAYGSDFYGLSKEAKENLLAYTELLFIQKPSKKTFSKMQAYMENAEAEGWKQLLEETDMVDSFEEMEKLWVRRHNYDPGTALKNLESPLLAIYGEIDWIVPYKENIDLLNDYFTGERSSLLKAVIAHDAEHGTEVAGKYIELAGGKSYWRFYRISPSVLIEIVSFLRENNVIRK